MADIVPINPILYAISAASTVVPIIGMISPSLVGAPVNYDGDGSKIDKGKMTDQQLADIRTRLPANDFGGPLGAAIMPIFLPSFVYFLYFACTKDNLASILPWSSNFMQFNVNPFADGLGGFFNSVFDLKTFLIYCTWVFGHWTAYYIVPGTIVEGTPLRAPFQHIRLKYKLNAVACHFLSILSLGFLVYFDVLPATFGYDNFIQLFTSAWIFAMTLSVLLYVDSKVRIPTEESQLNGPLSFLSLPGNGGALTYDFWMGRTLNPRLGFLDLKYVCELRPGLILWAMLNFSIAAAQYRELGYISFSMILVCVFQWYYVLDSATSEEALLTTMDIREDGFGFMLAFGDLCWVPFTYTLQARYLVHYDPSISIYAAGAIVLVTILGMWLFRASNNQKNLFRTNPNHPDCAHLKFIKTANGRNLLCSGWWGLSRHFNYLADWIMALAWSLTCGFGSIMPYFYPIYFAALLINRESRDNEKCHRNYGKDWDRYCQLVPYRIVPYIY